MATYIAHGDVALSVLMTTASTVGAIFMTPLLTKLLAGALVPVDAAVSCCKACARGAWLSHGLLKAWPCVSGPWLCRTSMTWPMTP